jgi:hypothetical protein
MRLALVPIAALALGACASAPPAGEADHVHAAAQQGEHAHRMACEAGPGKGHPADPARAKTCMAMKGMGSKTGERK